MPETPSLQLGQRQRQFLTQQQIRLAKILELTAPELDEAVERELEENPALESADESGEEQRDQEGDPYRETEEEMRRADYADDDEIPPYRLRVNNASPDDDMPRTVVADDSESLYDVLLAQIGEHDLPEQVAYAARFIIGNLDSNGYLRRTPSQIVDDVVVASGRELSLSTVKAALDVVHSLEPYGLGASDLRECLLIQLQHKPESLERNDAIEILDRAFDAFSMKHTHRIISQLHLSPARVEQAIALILSLNPKPGASLGNGPGSRAATVIPDFLIEIDGDEITVTLNNRYPELRISQSFESAVKNMEQNARRRKRTGADFLKSRYNEARDFINLLRQRQTTLFSVMTAIVRAQREFFLTDDVHTLRPLGIKDVAAATGYDMSVISRATAGKYAATPAGVFPLRFFFSDALGENGEEFTAKGVMEMIRRFVDEEDKLHPLSDEKLKDLICESGYDISRRAVAKYRDRMEIPVARLRRKM